MRFFKHGDSLAIVLPEPLRKNSGVQENDEYEFLEVEQGAFVLISKAKLADQAKRSVFASMCAKTVSPPSAAPVEQKQTPIPSKPAVKPVTPFELIERKGFFIVENEADAKNLSKALEQEIKAGLVRGVRGFDKKFYVVSTLFLKAMSQKFGAALSGKEPLTPAQLAQAASCDENACNAVLQVLKEDGDVLEKKRGYFVAVK
ncbi:AbrB/MazE/SpoVT family DNA-binding domain-containing protein [Candidatus Micrarchaeota archaeon]|nr:AbrB/MazE/SpoVT family DNA-binding domain-containing protein [Candidatus Micrarchaeota archaeon]